VSAPPPASQAPGRLTKAVVVAFFVLNGLTGLADVKSETPWGAGLHHQTAGYKRALGIAQTWSMFAPSPPMANYWLEVETLRANGEWVLVPRAHEPHPGPVRVRQWRGEKEERNQFTTDNGWLRRIRARAECNRATAAGVSIAGVRFTRKSTSNPRPRDRVAGDLGDGVVRSKELDTIWCKR
jgi:hypothetical protein